MGVELCACYAVSSIAPFDEFEGESDAPCKIAGCTNSCEGFEAYCNNVLGDVGTGEELYDISISSSRQKKVLVVSKNALGPM